MTRDKKAVVSAMVAKNDSYIATKEVRIYTPLRFKDKNLITFGDATYILGIFAYVVDGNKYAISLSPSMVSVEPDFVNEVYIDQTVYLELIFEKGSRVIVDRNLINDDKLLYHIYNEVLSQGNIPKFFNYDSLSYLFNFDKYFTGTKVANSILIIHLLLSLVARDPNDLNNYFRTVYKKELADSAVFIPIRSVTHGATNTTARLMNGYFTDKTISALNNPSTREEDIEHILRL